MPDDIAIIVESVSNGRIDVVEAAGAIRAIGAEATLASLAGFLGEEDMAWPVSRVDDLRAAVQALKAACEDVLDALEAE